MGVLGAIIPWNYPFHNMLGQVISAIFSGNAIVLKVSEHTCWSSIFFADVVKKVPAALLCAGLPAVSPARAPAPLHRGDAVRVNGSLAMPCPASCVTAAAPVSAHRICAVAARGWALWSRGAWVGLCNS